MICPDDFFKLDLAPETLQLMYEEIQAKYRFLEADKCDGETYECYGNWQGPAGFQVVLVDDTPIEIWLM